VIRDERGHQWTLPVDIGGVFSQYFKNLFTSPGVQEVEGVLEAVPPRVTPEMNEALLRPFQFEEIKIALFQMQPLTAPGSDGFGVSFFFQHH
jgi:hypothetical protein